MRWTKTITNYIIQLLLCRVDRPVTIIYVPKKKKEVIGTDCITKPYHLRSLWLNAKIMLSN